MKKNFLPMLALVIILILPAQVSANVQDLYFDSSFVNEPVVQEVWFLPPIFELPGYYFDLPELEPQPIFPIFREMVPDERAAMGRQPVGGAVELVPWEVMRTLNLIPVGQDLTVTDTRTGISWQMRSMSNGNHADVEPITAADTFAMYQAFGFNWSWATRPIWVEVGGRTFAASINGQPHAGQTNMYNNMDGHVCMHFRYATTHNGNRWHELDHQCAVYEAYLAWLEGTVPLTPIIPEMPPPTSPPMIPVFPEVPPLPPVMPVPLPMPIAQ